MTPTLNKRNQKMNLLLYYQCILAISFVLAFGTNLDVYLFDAGITSPPTVWITIFGIAAIPLLLSFSSRFKYLLSVQTETITQVFRNRAFLVFFIILGLFIFSGNKIVETWVKRTIFIVTVIAIINNFHELIDPLTFTSLNESGRPAGFYQNPNTSGCAILLGLIFSISILPIKYRLIFLTMCGIGVFITFSRGAMLGWVIITVIFIVKRIISRRQAMYAIFAIGILISLGISSDFILNQVGANLSLEDNAMTRMQFLLNPSLDLVNDDTSRLDIVPFSWRKFLESPIFGHGIGYTHIWGDIRPHNIYLMLIVEHGFLGILIVPILVFLTIQNAQLEIKNIGFSFAVFILIWGFFSHNILEERNILLMFSFMTSMNLRSQIEQLNSCQKTLVSKNWSIKS
jgi:O-antigen ligase